MGKPNLNPHRLFGPCGVVAYSGTAGSLPRVIAAAISAATTAAMLGTALQLRAGIRDYLQRDPVERGSNKDTIRSLNGALKPFPLAVDLRGKDGARLKATGEDALSGLSQVVAELYNGSRDGTLDRLKMCASDECRRVFFDRSKPATRRWCMSTLCGNRIKTRNYRERQRHIG